ncbi:MAG: helix-turn-helix domain-containing protein [Candidatus Accumulibacter sp.]|jgi:transcriptional regulator with XRE-family HTH domain|nr:helix-turn-helix domain-containing protein [Accumulibacter sp.]
MISTPSQTRKYSAREVLASNLRRLRAERKMSQEDLALEAELHRTFVAHVERGARNISIDNVEKLADALAIPIHDLLQPNRVVAGKLD